MASGPAGSAPAQEALRKDLEQRLSTVFHIKVDLASLDEAKQISIIGSLLHVYDPSWKLPAVPSLIGNHAASSSGTKAGRDSGEEETETGQLNPYWTDKKVIRQLKSWLIRVGVGHHASIVGKKLSDGSKFVQLVGILMDNVERSHGTKLKTTVRQIVQKQHRESGRLSTRVSRPSTTERNEEKSDDDGLGTVARGQKDEPQQGEDFAKPSVAARPTRKKRANKENKNQKEANKKEEEVEDLSEQVPPLRGKELERTPLKPREPVKTAVDSDEDYLDKDQDQDYSPPRLVVRPLSVQDRYPSFTPSPRADKAKRNTIPTGTGLPRTPLFPVEAKDTAGEASSDTGESKQSADQCPLVTNAVSTPTLTGDAAVFKKPADCTLAPPNVIPSGTQLPRTPADPEESRKSEGLVGFTLPKGKYFASDEKPPGLTPNVADNAAAEVAESKKRKRGRSGDDDDEQKPKLVLDVVHQEKQPSSTDEQDASSLMSEAMGMELEKSGQKSDSALEGTGVNGQGGKSRVRGKPQKNVTSSIPGAKNKKSDFPVTAEVKTLPNLTRDRVKTPKKRPPTRRQTKKAEETFEVENTSKFSGVGDPAADLTYVKVPADGNAGKDEGKDRTFTKCKSQDRIDEPDVSPAAADSQVPSDDKVGSAGRKRNATAPLQCLTKNRAATPKRRRPSRKLIRAAAEGKEEKGLPKEASPSQDKKEDLQERLELYLSPSEDSDGDDGKVAANPLDSTLDSVSRKEKPLTCVTKTRAATPKRRLPKTRRVKGPECDIPEKKNQKADEERPETPNTLDDALFDDEEEKVSSGKGPAKKKKFKLANSPPQRPVSEMETLTSPIKAVEELLELSESLTPEPPEMPCDEGEENTKQKPTGRSSAIRKRGGRKKAAKAAKAPSESSGRGAIKKKRSFSKVGVPEEISPHKLLTDVTADSGCSPLKRGRGRPRKTGKEEQDDTSGPKESPPVEASGPVGSATPKNKRGRPKQNDTVADEVSSGLPTSSSKTTALLKDSSASESSVIPKKLRGRPKKTEKESVPDGTPAPDAPTRMPVSTLPSPSELADPKKKRGRPKLAKAEDVSKNDSSEQAESPNASFQQNTTRSGSKKIKGRPKKNAPKSDAAETSKSTSAHEETSVSREVKKQAKDDSSVEVNSSSRSPALLESPNTSGSVPPKRQRGRPKKRDPCGEGKVLGKGEIKEPETDPGNIFARAMEDPVQPESAAKVNPKTRGGRKKTNLPKVSPDNTDVLNNQEEPSGPAKKSSVGKEKSVKSFQKPGAKVAPVKKAGGRGRRKKADDTIVENDLEKMEIPETASMKVVDDVYLTPRVRVRAANGNAARKKGATNAVLAPELPDELCPTPATKKGAAGRRGRAKNAAVAVQEEVEDDVYQTPAPQKRSGSQCPKSKRSPPNNDD